MFVGKLRAQIKTSDGKTPSKFFGLSHTRTSVLLGLVPGRIGGGFYAGASLAGSSRPKGLTISVPRSLWGVDCFTAEVAQNRKCRAEPRFPRDLISSPRMTALFGDCPLRDRER